MTLIEEAVTVLSLDKIHFVDEAEDRGAWRVFFQGFDDLCVRVHVAFDFAGLDIEDIDEYSDIREDVLALRDEVGFGEGVLSAAVPKIECEVAHEFGVAMLDIDRCPKAADIFGDIIAKYD